MLRYEFNVGMLKNIIEKLPDDMPVFVACHGICNYDFNKEQPRVGTDTFGIEYNGKLSITDEWDIDVGEGEFI